jgi:hypothetical protein
MPDGAMLRGAMERAVNRAELIEMAQEHRAKWAALGVH